TPFGSLIPNCAAISASSRTSAGPSPAVIGRCCAGGSVSTCSTVADPRWKKRRIALRAGGTAIAIARATTATATASTSGRRHRRRAPGQARARARRADAVASLVGDDLQQPGPKGRAPAKASERPPGLDESVLRRLLRVGGVARDHVGGTESNALVCVHELLVGVCVTALRALDQV